MLLCPGPLLAWVTFGRVLDEVVERRHVELFQGLGGQRLDRDGHVLHVLRARRWAVTVISWIPFGVAGVGRVRRGGRSGTENPIDWSCPEMAAIA